MTQYSGKERKNGKRSIFHSLPEYVLRTINMKAIELEAKGQYAIMYRIADFSLNTQFSKDKLAFIMCSYNTA